ncbi:CAP domain-containing protein, partial [Halobaculum sp. EA56]|uniref:CAP domain-containing protein n=1 Tax=Halobaculum sp. EA56 TaxID=3421648 RepID=UPI003EB9968C
MIVLVAMVSLAGCLSSVGADSEPVVRSQEPAAWEGDTPKPPKFGHHQPDNEIEIPAPLPSKTPRDDVNVTIAEELLYQKLNLHRKNNNISVLVLDPRLSRIARYHSHDMATRNFFNHTNPDGDTFTDRVRASSYACGGGGENIRAVFWNKSYTQTEEELAEVILRGFIRSPEHNTGMLLPSHDT